ncbi:MAG: cation:proton antiporter, partial [Nitrososphaeraceae archaeon]|nr:cation:proton antiporter [Nitrososphaeraceae archaeon]
LRSALGLATAKGEMSLVIAKGGQDVGAITSSVLPILSVVTIITSFACPYIIRFAQNIGSSKTDNKIDEEKKA